MFVNDTRLFSQASFSDVAHFQADLVALVQWSNGWLIFIQSKEVLDPAHWLFNLSLAYYMDEKELVSTSLEKGPLVFIDADLKFGEQALPAVAKATQIPAVIRSFALIDKAALPLLFIAFVHAHLKQDNLIRGPLNMDDKRLVESVQRRATGLVVIIKHKPYEVRLRLFQLPLLYCRHKQSDVIHTYQLFSGGVDANFSDFFTLGLANEPIRRHQ